MNENTTPPPPNEPNQQPKVSDPPAHPKHAPTSVPQQSKAIPADKITAEDRKQKAEPKRDPQLIKEPITLQLLVHHLLKEPLDVTHSIRRNSNLPWAPLLCLTIGAFALFGLILGMFSGGHQLWAAPTKIAGGILFASVISLPSLFIFSSLCKVDTNFKTMVGVLTCAVCIIALLLLGFIPILWLFSTTSESVAFFGFLTLCTWIICLSIGLSFIGKSLKYLGAKGTLPIQVWFLIFALVTLQMPTTLRPIIGETEDDFINFKEKKFFLVHWVDILDGDTREDLDFHR